MIEYEKDEKGQDEAVTTSKLLNKYLYIIPTYRVIFSIVNILYLKNGNDLNIFLVSIESARLVPSSGFYVVSNAILS